MAGVASGLRRYVGYLVATAIFPWLWAKCIRFAGNHEEHDPRAPTKVGVAIVASVILGVGGAYALVAMDEAATDGFYDSLVGRMQQATGEAAYQGFVEARSAAAGSIQLAQERIQSAADDEERALWQDNLARAQEEHRMADENVTALTANHDLFLALQVRLEAQDDGGARSVLATTLVTFPDMQANARDAFAIKDDAVADLGWTMRWLLIPSAVGMFYAPMAFALGSTLATTFKESESVGFKGYPSKAAGWFLLFGAFGVPSLFFAAWTFMDVEARAAEGQIAL